MLLRVLLLVATLVPPTQAGLSDNVTISAFVDRDEQTCQDNPDAPVCNCPCASQLVTVTQYLQGGSQCMVPKETTDGTNIDPATTVYDNTGGRSPLSCAQLPQTFGKDTWSAYAGQRASWTNGPAYATKLNTWTYAFDIGSSHVCANDRTCLSEVHDSMKSKLYEFEKKNTTAWPQRTLNRPDTYEDRSVCDYSKSSRTKLNECTARAFSQPLADEYCSKLGMRLCDTNELMFEGETRHCSNHAYFVWTKTPCKNIRTSNSDPNSDNWDPDYFWLVKQYPYYWSEAGDRICAHKDKMNKYLFRVNTGTYSASRMRGVTCCADTSHSPRFTLRYDDNNWSNEEAVWPASDRSIPSDGLRVGWTYRKNPTTATSTDGTVIPEGTLRLTYHSRFAGPTFKSCQKVYDHCMAEQNNHVICARSNCKFVHGPFTQHTVKKTINFVSPIKNVRINFRFWAVGDWQSGRVVRALVKNHGPIWAVSKASNNCVKGDGWRTSDLTWKPRADASESLTTLYCYFDASVEFEMAAAQSDIELTFQEIGDPNLPDTAWWGMNHLQIWSTADDVGESLKGKRGKSRWGKHQDLILHQDMGTANSDGTTTVKIPDATAPKFEWTFTDANGVDSFTSSSSPSANTFTQVLNPTKLNNRIGVLANSPNNNGGTTCGTCQKPRQMRVSYDPSNPNNRNIQSMDVYLKDFPGGLWNGLAAGHSSPRIQTMNGKYNGRSRYIKADFRLITVGRWDDASVSVYAQDYRDDDVAYLKWTLTITSRVLTASKGSYVTQNGVVVGYLATRCTGIAYTQIIIHTIEGVTVTDTAPITIAPNEEASPTFTIAANDISAAASTVKAATASPRGRLQNRKKLFPVAGTTYSPYSYSGNTGVRTDTHSCSGGWKVLPDSIWLPTVDNTSPTNGGIRQTHGVACYIDVELRRIHNWGNPIRFTFESDIVNNVADTGELASYFAVTDFKVYASQKVEVANEAEQCPGDGCTGMLVGLVDGQTVEGGTYYGGIMEENFGYHDGLAHRGDLRWDHGLRSTNLWGGGKVASPEASGLTSTCNLKPIHFSSTHRDTYDRTKCEMCGGDFWCARNQPFPNATFVDPLRSDVNDPIRGRVITRLIVKTFGSMNMDKWHLPADAQAGHVWANGIKHASKVPSSGRDHWLYCNDCYESGSYQVNEGEIDTWGYKYAEAVVTGGGAGTWSITEGSGVNNLGIEPPQHGGWCLSKVEYQICAKPGPPVIEKIEIMEDIGSGTVLCSSADDTTCDINSDGESIIKITGYNFGPQFQVVKYGPLSNKGLGYEMKACNLTKDYGNREVICKTETGTGDGMYIVVFANNQPSEPFKSVQNNDGVYTNGGFALDYKSPKILPSLFVSNDDVNLPNKFVSTDGSDAPVVLNVLHTAIGNVGRVVDILIHGCSTNAEGDGEVCDFEETGFGDGGAGTDATDPTGSGGGDEEEGSQLTLAVKELETVADVSKRAFVNFTVHVTVTTPKLGQIGQSYPEPLYRGLIFYEPPTTDEYVDVVYDGADAVITVTGNNFGGTVNVGGYKVCGRRGNQTTCNQVLGDATNPILTNGGLSNFVEPVWGHNRVVFRMNKTECCPGSVFLQVANQVTTTMQYPGRSPKLELSLEERSKIRDNRDGSGVAQYYATKGGDVVTGIKVKYMNNINEVKIKVGGVEASIRSQNTISCSPSPCDDIFSYDIDMPEGQGTDVQLQVINTNNGAEAGSDILTVNYKPPTLSKISLEVNGGTQELASLDGNFNRYMEQPGIPTLGNMLILDGSNFGQQGYVKWCLDPSATKAGCSENTKHTVECCNKWEGDDTQVFKSLNSTGGSYGHDQIKINVPAGVGVGRAIYVVQHRTSETTKKFDQISQVFALRYKAPRVTSVGYEGGSSGHQYADTRGGTRITLSGNYFGSASAIGEVVPSVPTIRLYRQSDIDSGNEKIQKEEEEADSLNIADDRTSSLTNVNYPSWGPAITIESTGWTDSSATFVVPKGIGYNISIALTVGEQSSIDYHLSLLHFDASLFQYNPPIITGVTPDSVPSSGLVHDTCVRDKDCEAAGTNQGGSCDVGICSVGRAINMTITGNYFGDEDTSSGCAGFVQCPLESKTPTNTNNAWRIRVQFINLGEITREVEAKAMTMLNQHVLSFPAPNSIGQAESTGYRIIVGNQVSEVYRQFTCASITDATERQKCESDLASFKDIEDKLLKDSANGNNGDVNVDRDRLVGVLNGMDGTGKSVVDEPSLVKVTPLQGPTDGCDVHESIDAYQTRRKAETGGNADGRGVGGGDGGNADAAEALELELPAKCLHRDRITISGLSLGNGDFTSNRLEVWLTNVTVDGSGYKVFDAESSTSVAACNSITQFPYDASDNSLPGGCSHGDNKIVFPAPISPPNYGKELYYYVKIGGSPSRNALNGNGKAFLPWDFSPPVVKGVTPSPFDARGAVEEGTVSFSGEKCATSNCQLEIRGKNFGGSSSEVIVTIGGKKCLEPEWKPAHPKDGLPYLRCKPQQDVVGDKNTTIVVAAQSQTFAKGSFDFSSKCRIGLNPSNRLDNPNAPESYFGRVGELCVPCPEGAICYVPTSTDGAPVKWDNKRNQYLDPISDKSFFRITLNTTTKLEEATKRCDTKRVEASTDSMVKKFPAIVDKGFCFDFVGCMPKESCLGENKCAQGYEHVTHKCNAWQAANPPAKSLCRSNNDCRTRSGRSSDSWNIEENCNLAHPEDCAVCDFTVPRDNSTGEAPSGTGRIGTCSCSPPRRCALCTKAAPGFNYPGTKDEVEGYFRLDGECEECPKNPILLFVFFFVAIFFLLIGGFILSQKDFNVAFISIGVDYFQVLSILRSARVEWPAFLKALLQAFSIFNVDIDVTAPECLIPEFTYEVKWWVSIMLPAASGVMLVLMFVLSKAINLCMIERRKSKFTLSALISMSLLIIYYVYLMVTKRALELLNCNPASPPDGHLYTEFTDLECEASVCRCWENDSVLGASAGVQQRLYPWAIVVLFAFTLGFPLLLGLIIFSNKKNIKIDQILRAYDVDINLTESLSNVRTVRERFHKIYYYFKPGKVYWIIYIVARKGSVAIVALLFRDNPAFQFSLTVLVLFMSFVGAVKHRPYMSTAERQHEVAHHLIKVQNGDKFHTHVDNIIKTALQKGAWEQKLKTRRKSRIHFNKSAKQIADREKNLAATKKKNKTNVYFFDYNTVERVLLASSIVVCLAGIMFESGRFNERPDLVWQRDTITVVVIAVVVFSIMYYFVVFIAETGASGGFVTCLIRTFSEKKRPLVSGGSGENNASKWGVVQGAVEDGDLEMMVNPAMFTDENGKRHSITNRENKEKREQAEEELRNATKANQMLQLELKKSKKTNLMGKAHTKTKGRGGTRNKKGFGQKKPGRAEKSSLADSVENIVEANRAKKDFEKRASAASMKRQLKMDSF